MSYEAFQKIVMSLWSKSGLKKRPRFKEEDGRQGKRFIAYVGDKIITGCPANFGITVNYNKRVMMVPKNVIERELVACSA